MNEPITETPPRWPEELGSSLRRELAAVRRKLVWVEVIRRLALAASVGVIGLVAFLAVDWVADCSIDLRGAILAGLATLVGLLAIHALAALVTRRLDEDSLALLVEREQPGFESRLIASVQFARGKGTIPVDRSALAMVERLVRETETYAKPLVLTEAVNTRALTRALIVFVLLGGIAAGGFLAGGSITRDLLKRAFLADLPVPRATRVFWTSGDLKTGIGDAVTIEAQVRGFEPERGTVRIRYASGRKQNLRIEPVEGVAGGYAGTLENVQESFTYVVALHDGRSERSAVRALPRPAVVELSGRQTYPAYTGLAPSDHQPGEFLLFPGSRLDLTITASQPLERGALRMLGGNPPVTAKVEESDPRLLRASFIAPESGLTGFTVELLDREEMVSRDATVYRIDILGDEPPRARIVRPSRQRELATPEARVRLVYEAEDRFGVEKVTLAYSLLVDGRPNLIERIDLPVASRGSKVVAEAFDWRLEDIEPPLRPGDEIQYWIEAFDRNPDPVAGTSAPRILEVVTPREKRDDLLSRVGDSLGRIDQATSDQERLNAVLAEWIRAQAPNPSRPESKSPADGNPE